MHVLKPHTRAGGRKEMWSKNDGFSDSKIFSGEIVLVATIKSFLDDIQEYN